MVLGNTRLVHAVLLQQPGGGLVGFLVQRLQHLVFQAQAGQQKPRQVGDLVALQLLGAVERLRCVALRGEGHVADPFHDGLAGLHLVVLADDDGRAKGRVVSLIAPGAHARGAHVAAVVGVFQLVPVEALNVRTAAGLGFPVGLDQHDGQV